MATTDERLDKIEAELRAALRHEFDRNSSPTFAGTVAANFQVFNNTLKGLATRLAKIEKHLGISN